MGNSNDAILNLYDMAADKRKQIGNIARLYKMSIEEVEKIITSSGREIPKKRGPKPKLKEEERNTDSVRNNNDSEENKAKNQQKDAKREVILPDIVKEIITREIDDLDSKIKLHEQAIENYKNRYTALANFIKNPLGWNLSQDESHCSNASDISGGRKEDHVKEDI